MPNYVEWMAMSDASRIETLLTKVELLADSAGEPWPSDGHQVTAVAQDKWMSHRQ